MKLLEKGNRIAIFETGIVIDENLLKYKNLINDTTEKVKLDPKAGIDKEFELTIQSDPDSITPGQFLFLESENEKKAVDSVVNGLLRVKEFINSGDARKFNISISSKLLESLKKNNSVISRRINGFTVLNISTDSDKSMVGGSRDGGKTESSFLKRLFGSKKKETEKKVTEEPKKVYDLNVIELFDQIKILAGKEKEFKERTEAYLGLVHKAVALNQEAQLEKLISELVIHVYESVLAVSGINHYITTQDLVTLQKKCEKQLDIDYIKNFTRVVPDSVAEKKIWADNLQVFDNYVVLYYDPTGKSFDLTEYEKKEIERIKKDPILFGVIQGSDRLYYIDSWVDEFCDLTWDQVVEKLSKDKTL